MTENSPVIPTESLSCDVRDFFGSPPRINSQLRHISARFLCRSTLNTFTQVLTNIKRQAPCTCPCILVADDDPFQGFFYEILFQRTIKWPKGVISRGTPQYEVLTSGEDLIKRFKQIRACGCNQTVLIISDYEMGYRKLNGVQTLQEIRDAGYKGAAILRTSEAKSTLMQKHTDFLGMLESKAINSYVGKTDSKMIREIVQEIITNIKNQDTRSRSQIL